MPNHHHRCPRPMLLALVAAIAFVTSPGCKSSNSNTRISDECRRNPAKCKDPTQAELAKKARESFDDAAREFNKKEGRQLDDVIDHLEDAVDTDPGMAKAWFNMGLIYEMQGKPDKASEAYNKAIEIDTKSAESQERSPEFGAPYVNLGMMALESGDKERAWSYFKRAEEIEPFNPEAHNNLSVILREREQYLEAVSHARRALAGEPRNTRAYVNLARIWYERGNYDVARLVLINGIDINDKDPDLHNIYGLVELAQNDVTKAIERFIEALKLDPNHVPAHMNMGAIKLSVRDYDKAIEHFEKVLSKRPEDMEAYISMAVAYRGKGDLERAEKIYREVVEKDPDNAMVQFNLGVLEQEHLAQNAMLGDPNQQFDDPVESLQVNIENMNDAVTHYEKAIQHYRNYLSNENGDDEEHRAEANKRIDQIANIITMTKDQVVSLKQTRDEMKAAAVQAGRRRESRRRRRGWRRGRRHRRRWLPGRRRRGQRSRRGRRGSLSSYTGSRPEPGPTSRRIR